MLSIGESAGFSRFCFCMFSLFLCRGCACQELLGSPPPIFFSLLSHFLCDLRGLGFFSCPFFASLSVLFRVMASELFLKPCIALLLPSLLLCALLCLSLGLGITFFLLSYAYQHMPSGFFCNQPFNDLALIPA